VRQQILDEVEFWLKRGVDGLRLDAINFCFHDKELRSNPVKPEDERKGRGFSLDNPYAFQKHIYDNTRPENIAFLESLRALMDRYPGTVTLGEISADDSLKTMAEYTAGNSRLHMAYSFELLVDKLSGSYIRETVETLEKNLSEGWPCWAIGNHDVRRFMSRWGGKEQSPQLAKTLNTLLLSLRGSVCSYQGEELGLTEAEIAQHELQDPYGITFWPRFKGRDGCRTPMPWSHTEAHAGFSQAQTWLPIPAAHKERAVSLQEDDSNSILNAYRTFMHWRKQQPCLRLGDIKFVAAADDYLVFIRSFGAEKLLCAFNFSANAQTILLDGSYHLEKTEGHGCHSVVTQSNNLSVPGYATVISRVV
jgi:alpha-glucosidase